MMITLCIRYTFDPNKINDFKAYVEAEQGPIARSGGKAITYFLPTDFAGPTNEAIGLIDLPNLAAYEAYRSALAKDPEHKKNAARLEASGAALAMNRSIIQRIGQA
jgi:NIPSNAP